MDLPKSVELAGPEVNLDGVADALLAYVGRLGDVHEAIFAIPLVITSGKDGAHAPGSLHGQGRAVDLRTHDKSDVEMVIFLAVLAYSAGNFHCTVFDERALPGAPHMHIEYHGE